MLQFNELLIMLDDEISVLKFISEQLHELNNELRVENEKGELNNEE